MSYLLSSPTTSSCVQASQVLQVSHDQVNRFLLKGNYTGKDLYEKAKPHLLLHEGTLSIDDTVLDKPYSEHNSELITFLYSGRHHRVVKGIGLIVLLYTDVKGVSLPVNFRIYQKASGLTKNDYFQQMVKDVLQWGLQPKLVTGDSWYASTANFKFLRNQELSFMFGVEKNRIISTQPGVYQQVCTATIPPQGLYTHLKEFDFVHLFQTVDSIQTVDPTIDVNDQNSDQNADQNSDQNADPSLRYYVYFEANEQKRSFIQRSDFELAHKHHWQIEVFHRICKQVCKLEKFFVRTTAAIKTHLFGALRAFIRLTALVHDGFIDSFYSLHRHLFLNAQREFILNFA